MRIILLLLIVLCVSACDYQNARYITAKVTDKERITESVSDGITSYYLVYTDKEVFKISDQLFFGKFNSSDLYGQLKKDSTYRFKVYGYRVPIISMYPNIRSFKKAVSGPHKRLGKIYEKEEQ